MRVCIVPDPALVARAGGLQVQVRETLDALLRLRRQGAAIEVQVASAHSAALGGCDVLHVFGLGEGSDRLVAAAAEMKLPVLLSARVAPGWTRSNGTRSRVADRVQGNLTDWDFDTGYACIRRSLQLATLIVALAEAEKRAIGAAFLIEPDKVRVIPNAVAAQFFEANPAAFRERTRIAGQFALMVGDVSPYNRQLEVARLLAALALPLVVIGDARERDAGYERELRTVRTVTCLGALSHDDPVLASACAAASVLVVCGQAPALPMTALEALAAGTPVVTGAAQPVQLAGSEFAFKQVDPNDRAALAYAVAALMDSPPDRKQVRALAGDCTWDAVAAQLLACYRQLAGARP